jgi:hypothetical protein
MMFVLGLTGSIGMGKSTVARFFAEAGVPVHDADGAVHRLYEGEAAAAIEAAFPGTAASGKVDRVKLAERVLDDLAAIRRLEAIIHPLVRESEAKFWPRPPRGAPWSVGCIRCCSRPARRPRRRRRRCRRGEALYTRVLGVRTWRDEARGHSCEKRCPMWKNAGGRISW